MISAVAAISAAGFDVLPRENKYNYKYRWPRAYMVADSLSCQPDSTNPVMYYIVEYRFATIDTFANVRIDNNMGYGDIGIGFRVASVNHAMNKMSEFTNPVYNDTLFYGIDFDTPEWSCESE